MPDVMKEEEEDENQQQSSIEQFLMQSYIIQFKSQFQDN